MTANNRSSQERGMYSYSAYGLTIHSEAALPELWPGGDTADVVIRFGPVLGPSPNLPGDAIRWIGGSYSDLTIWWSFLGTVRIRDGCQVTVDLLPGVSDRALRTMIMGSIMGVLLLQRSPSVFHASAVNVADGAVAFMAHKGCGKSTMAATLLARGHTIISDDLVALDQAAGHPAVQPGFHEIKLWPDSLEALGEHPEELERVNPEVEKRALPLNGHMASTIVPLRRVYVLVAGPEIKVERLAPKQALFEVMPHWYGAQFDGDLLPLVSLTDHLCEVWSLVNQVPVYRLSRPEDLKLLDPVAACVERHADAQAAVPSAG